MLADKKIAVPSKSIIFDNSKTYVLVYHDRSHVEIREVVTDGEFGDKRYISGGLKEGETVISGNQLLIFQQLSN